MIKPSAWRISNWINIKVCYSVDYIRDAKGDYSDVYPIRARHRGYAELFTIADGQTKYWLVTTRAEDWELLAKPGSKTQLEFKVDIGVLRPFISEDERTDADIIYARVVIC